MAERVIVEADKRLSESLIWEIQRRYFMTAGMAAWREDVVPHQISCNPLMAWAYGEVILGYVQDCVAAGVVDEKRPLYIIELGAGSGRLTHHLLHQFYPRFLASPFKALPVRFVLTDFVPKIVDFWRGHEKLRPWVEKGVLDFGLFDVGAMRPIELVASEETLTPEQMQNPVILLANYFFDSIPQDSFVIENGELNENLLTLYSSRPEPDLGDPTIWERLELAYEALPLQEPYAVKEYNQILERYEAQLPDTVLTFPNVGLDCVRFWEGFGHGRVLLLTADRGYRDQQSLAGQDNPLPNLHGSFSLMVNYQAISAYVQAVGGRVLQVPHYQDNLQLLAYLLGEVPHDGWQTEKAFEAAVIHNGPDDFFALKQAVEQSYDTMSLSQLLSVLRWSHYDPELFQDCFDALAKQIQEADPIWYADIAVVVDAVRKQYLPLRADDKVAKLARQLLR